MIAQFVLPPSDSQGQRWRRWVNLSGVDCPAFGCVQLGKHSSDPAAPTSQLNHRFAADDTRSVLLGYLPDQYAIAGGEPGLFGFNSGATVPKDAEGWLTQDYPARCLRQFSSGVGIGTSIGPVAGYWWLRSSSQIDRFFTLASAGAGRFRYQQDPLTIITDAEIVQAVRPMSHAYTAYGYEPASGDYAEDGHRFTFANWSDNVADGVYQNFYLSPQNALGPNVSAGRYFDGGIVINQPGVYVGQLAGRIYSNHAADTAVDAGLTVGILDGPDKNPSTPDTVSLIDGAYAGRQWTTQDGILSREMVTCPLFFETTYPRQGLAIYLDYTPSTSGVGEIGLDKLQIVLRRVDRSLAPASV